MSRVVYRIVVRRQNRWQEWYIGSWPQVLGALVVTRRDHPRWRLAVECFGPGWVQRVIEHGSAEPRK